MKCLEKNFETFLDKLRKKFLEEIIWEISEIYEGINGNVLGETWKNGRAFSGEIPGDILVGNFGEDFLEEFLDDIRRKCREKNM